MGIYAGESKRQHNGGKQMALILIVEYHSAFRQDSAVHEQMLRAGADEVLHKEVPFRDVLAAVRRLGHQR